MNFVGNVWDKNVECGFYPTFSTFLVKFFFVWDRWMEEATATTTTTVWSVANDDYKLIKIVTFSDCHYFC